jgi:phospholipid/cholesterol/gamma-HCH transport system substrate-binding protein
MQGKREQVFVGLFVIAAVAVLLATVFALTGTFGASTVTYHTYFPFAGGLEPGATVRYAGGPKVGRVEKLQLDPKDPSRIEISFSVRAGLPVKTDSHVKIMSLSPLGDNHMEILAGTDKATLAPAGAFLQADPYVDFNSLTAKINDIAPQAQELLSTLNARALELKVTISRVNDLLSDENRQNLSGTLATTRGMLAENRGQIKETIGNLNNVSKKIEPLLADLRKTSAEANTAITHIDEVIGENRADLRQSIIQLKQSLATVNDLTSRLDQTLDVNSENIDDLLDNMRSVSENLKQFTDTIKKRPYTLIRSSNPKEHKPGDQH